MKLILWEALLEGLHNQSLVLFLNYCLVRWQKWRSLPSWLEAWQGYYYSEPGRQNQVLLKTRRALNWKQSRKSWCLGKFCHTFSSNFFRAIQYRSICSCFQMISEYIMKKKSKKNKNFDFSNLRENSFRNPNLTLCVSWHQKSEMIMPIYWQYSIVPFVQPKLAGLLLQTVNWYCIKS